MNMVSWRRGKLSTILILIQMALVSLFYFFVEYGDTANAHAPENSLDPDKHGADPTNNVLKAIYPSKYVDNRGAVYSWTLLRALDMLLLNKLQHCR